MTKRQQEDEIEPRVRRQYENIEACLERLIDANTFDMSLPINEFWNWSCISYNDIAGFGLFKKKFCLTPFPEFSFAHSQISDTLVFNQQLDDNGARCFIVSPNHVVTKSGLYDGLIRFA